MSFSLEWNGDRIIEEIEAASENGLNAASDYVVDKIQKRMPGPGASKSGDGKRSLYTSSQPGSSPGVRTNRLKSSISFQKSGKLQRVVGTNVKYAEIHEKGGVINHPGGTAYVRVGATEFAFIKNSDVSKYAPSLVKRTKPHTIRIPKRPFMLPGLKDSMGKVYEKFTEGFRARMKL
jgi:phage gpG-like protein